MLISLLAPSTLRCDIHECLIILFFAQDGVIEPDVLAFVPVDADVSQAGILIALELVDRVVHEGTVEDAEAYQKLKILHGESGHLFEEAWLQLGDDILEGALAVIGQVHEGGNPRRKFDELFLNLPALALVFFFFFAELEFFFLGELAIVGLALEFFDCLGFVDDGLDVLVQTAEAFDAHKCPHGFFIAHEPAQGIVVYIYQEGAFLAAGEQGGGGTTHRHVENACGIDAFHGAAVIGQHRQEADEFLDLLLRVGFVDIQTAGIVGNLPQGTVRRKIEDVAFLLENQLLVRRLPVRILERPRRLHPECSLEIGFRA